MSKIQKLKPIIRYLNELRDVLYDQKWVKNAPNFEVYYIYRKIKEKNGLRYDETLIPPRLLGKEFVKTKGHYHLGNYGELYKVISGEGIFLLQKKDEKDVYCVKAKKGEYIIVPPHYGHTIINPCSKTLKIGNWVSTKSQSDYETLQRKKGFCYYYTISGWVKNKNYKKIPKLHFKKSLKRKPKNLSFLE